MEHINWEYSIENPNGWKKIDDPLGWEVGVGFDDALRGAGYATSMDINIGSDYHPGSMKFYSIVDGDSDNKYPYYCMLTKADSDYFMNVFMSDFPSLMRFVSESSQLVQAYMLSRIEDSMNLLLIHHHGHGIDDTCGKYCRDR